MSNISSPFGQNEWLVEEMYRKFRDDPSSVDPSWHEFLVDYNPEPAGEPAPTATTSGDGSPTAAAAPATPAPAPGAPQTPEPAKPTPVLMWTAATAIAGCRHGARRNPS
ncbi:2-oxoglutarate dehydrogenase E1 subunit family protein, partial [Mycobacterium mantenii]|uniref:2-oxoglutarate dehydrogenase E1 subunit family protein n=1 Tax=Mycobacterium mantenii TaxID=560555 RepID=UPI000B0A12EE